VHLVTEHQCVVQHVWSERDTIYTSTVTFICQACRALHSQVCVGSAREMVQVSMHSENLIALTSTSRLPHLDLHHLQRRKLL
jgi:hypothetical protein